MFCERIGLQVSLSLVQDSRRNQPQLGSTGMVSGGNRGSDEDFSGGVGAKGWRVSYPIMTARVTDGLTLYGPEE